jgi:hypothetical protein
LLQIGEAEQLVPKLAAQGQKHVAPQVAFWMAVEPKQMAETLLVSEHAPVRSAAPLVANAEVALQRMQAARVPVCAQMEWTQ